MPIPWIFILFFRWKPKTRVPFSWLKHTARDSPPSWSKPSRRNRWWRDRPFRAFSNSSSKICSLCFNPFTLRGTLESIVCYCSTFENNFVIKWKFTKYLKESFCLASDQHFFFKCFFRKCFCELNISKIIRRVLAALSVSGLNLQA